MIALAFVGISAFLGLQEQAQSPLDRLQARLAADHPDLEESRRLALARTLTDGIDRAAMFGHSAEELLRIVESQLGLRNEIEVQARALGQQVKPWIDDAADRLAMPDALRIRQREASFAVAQEYLSEVAARPSASESDKEAIRLQMARVRDEIRTALETKIVGPYGNAVIERSLRTVFEDQTGPELGSALAGAVTRPLSEEEMAQVLRRVQEEAAKIDPVQAGTEDDRLYSETGEVVANADAPASRLARRLSNLLYSFGEINYPKMARAAREEQAAIAEAAAWLKNEWGLLQRELEKKGVRRTAVRPEKAPLPSRSAPGMAMAAKPPTDFRPLRAPTSKAGEQSRPYWVVGILAALAVAIGLWTWSRYGRT